ncbi:ROK family protein [Lentisphaerota bacterium ZTH]|nr:ROK family protein [Lentisphaerota bacterium]WET06803.1 ROK family protein [Lentisphaerota bacterium ZTH]
MYETDKRIVLTLDAGGTNFVFSAVQGNKEIVNAVNLPAETKDLEKSLQQIKHGFEQVTTQLDQKPSAISFAFPGPADYPNGIIENIGNVPGFAGGVPLKSILEHHFKMPVFINNDGDLFVYGEAIAGLLPQVNRMLEESGSSKRYRNLFGITLGTGFGGGMVSNNELLIGDNSNATEVWLLRNRLYPECFAEEGACIRAIRHEYAKCCDQEFNKTPSPKEIADIAAGEADGCRDAALQAFNCLGVVLGDALATCTTLFDSLIVIGGGISNSYELFINSLLKEINGKIRSYSGSRLGRIVQKVYDLENENTIENFKQGKTTKLPIPGTDKAIDYDSEKRVGIGKSILGTSRAVSIGAYAFALNELDKKQ